MIARHLVVRGRVQGVFFRHWTVARARADALSGWVRNRPDGSVEIVAEGEPAAVEAFVAACRDGPPAARVAAVDVRDTAPKGMTGFERRRSG